MKKLSFEFTPSFFISCVLIFIVSIVFTAFLFFWNSHFFCSTFEINSSCKVSLMKGEDFDENVKNKGMKGLSLWHFFTKKDYETRKNSLKHSCEAGNQVSCFYHGLNLKTDGQDLNSFFIDACEKGSVVSACYEAGLEFMKLGRKDESSYYFVKACNSGNILSCLLVAKQSDSQESFKKIAEKIEEKMMKYRNSTSFEFTDKHRNMLKREISSQTAGKILDKELGMFFPETSEVFFRMDSAKEGSYYLEKAVKANKYYLYRIIDRNPPDLLTKTPRIYELIKETLQNIEKEIEKSEEIAKKI